MGPVTLPTFVLNVLHGGEGRLTCALGLLAVAILVFVELLGSLCSGVTKGVTRFSSLIFSAKHRKGRVPPSRLAATQTLVLCWIEFTLEPVL